MRSLLRKIDAFLKGHYPAQIISVVSLVLAVVAYRQSVEAVRPQPRLVEKEVIVCDDDYLGFSSSFLWVRLIATNEGGKPITLLHIEPDSAFGEWLIGVDSTDLGHRLNESYRLFLHEDKIRNSQELRCVADSLDELDKKDKIEFNVQIEPGSAYPFNIGIQYFYDSKDKYPYYQVELIGVFSDGSKVPFTTAFDW